MSWSRRDLLRCGAGVAAVGCSPRPLTGVSWLDGELLGLDAAWRAHQTSTGHPQRSAREAPVVICGGGVAGLSAAWRLAAAGVRSTVLELDDALGGTARGSEKGAWGAHYITMPTAESPHMVRLLRQLKVITGFSSGEPVYRADAVCYAPQERLYYRGAFVDGLMPPDLTSEERAAYAEFEQACRVMGQAVGSDGRPAFCIPIHKSSRDPRFTALLNVSFSEWLAREGYRGRAVHWATRYACRDDFGATPERVSAWAGLHYFCSRRVRVADRRDLGSKVLTWPQGNGYLVEGLHRLAKPDVMLRAAVRHIHSESAHHEVWFECDGSLQSIRAQRVILAMPLRSAAQILGQQRPALRAAPWLVAQLHLREPLQSNGAAWAWDSVPFEGASLGYVANDHQRGQFERTAGVLTWYRPMDEVGPEGARQRLGGLYWGQIADEVLDELGPLHPNLRQSLHRLDARIWGHGTAVPVVGQEPWGLSAYRTPRPGIWVAHAELSGISLFEEASYHGIWAAEAALGLTDSPQSWL